MEFFTLLPDPSGYSHKASGDVVSRTQVEGGFDVIRSDMEGVTTLFQVQYTVTPAQFSYIQDFVEAYFQAPDWFHVLLIGKPTNGAYPLHRYKAQIVPGTYKVQEIEGHRFRVAMTLEGFFDQPDSPTSLVYRLEMVDAISLTAAFKNGNLYESSYLEAIDFTSPEFIDGTLRPLLLDYDWPLEDAIDIGHPEFTDGTLRTLLLAYVWPYEDAIDFAHPEFTDGTLKAVLVVYSGANQDAIDLSYPTFINGTLA